MKEGIIFHGSFAKSFMYHAVSDGLAVPLEVEGDGDGKILRSILSDYKAAKKRKEVLELSLLYDKVFLYAYNDSFDLSRLHDESLAANIDPIDTAAYSKQKNLQEFSSYLDKEDVSTCKFLMPVVLPYLRRVDGRIRASKFNKMIELLSRDEFTEAVRKDKIPASLALEILPLSHIAEVIVDSFSLQYSRFPSLRAKILNMNKDEIGRTVFSILHLYDELITAIDLIKQSAQMSLPLASSLINNSTKSGNGKTDGILSELDDTYHRVFQVVVSEVEFFPVVNTLKDVLNLRNDKRMVDFRENVVRWSEALQNGKNKEEEKLRREIRKSNAALRSIKPWRKANGLVTYLSLPLGLVPFLSLPLSALGAAMQMYIDVKEWRHRWLMIGR